MNDQQSRDAIQAAAKELIERFGDEAASFAQERANNLSEQGPSPEHYQALMVLTAVESLMATTKNEPNQ